MDNNQSATPESIVAQPAAPGTTPSPAGNGLPGMPHVAAPTPSMSLGSLPKLGSSFGSTGGSSKSPLMLVMVVILGLGAVIFALMAVTFYGQAQSSASTLNVQKAAAATKAKADQKKEDDAANEVANESPFRNYTAPIPDGSFEVNFPKNWTATIDEEGGGTQVSLIMNPDFIRRENGQDDLIAAKVQLIERTGADYVGQFSGAVKDKKMTQNSITVSGQQGYDFTGQFGDRRTSREVIVPVRDKVIVFFNENSKYANEFNQILAQAKINP
jgi:hypothetical protein